VMGDGREGSDAALPAAGPVARGVTRRFVLGSALLLAGAGHVDAATGAAAPPSPDRAAASGRLTWADIEDLVAFAEVVVDGDPLAPEARQALADHVRERAARHASQEALYRTAVDLLRRLAATRFAEATPERRLELVARHRLGVTIVKADESVTDEVRAVRTRVARDLVAAHYGSPAGWRVVGYTSAFPGGCGDLEQYTRDGA